MKITLATHHGMCFGVRDALRKTHDTAAKGPATVLGQLVHNPVVQNHLDSLGLERGNLETVGSSRTERVIITAHGAADRDRDAWRRAGYALTDTTCPLVRKAHHALAQLVAAGCRPVVIGQAGHVEVRGLCGDFPDAVVIENEADLDNLPPVDKFGVVSQTTQPLAKVMALVETLRRRRPRAEVIFRDTVCQPTKDRQTALEALCAANELVVVIGGRNSNNTRQLAETAQGFGTAVRQVETAEDLHAEWFRGVETVGVTAGTSTLDETVQAVVTRLKQIAAGTRASSPASRLAPVIHRAITAAFA
ncbi:MAG: 4-hydroxy-3-methylbut-2-enyl diphosphate reductase [Verrucomicrobiota bacterium]